MKNISLRACRGIILLAIIISCQKIMDFPVEESGRIYVNGIIGDLGDGRIAISVSQPIEGELQNDITPEDVSIELKADGRPVELEYIERSGSKLIYETGERFSQGQKLTLRAGIVGVQDIEAETVIPDRIPDVSTKVSIEDNVYDFSIYIQEPPRKNSYFGVQILKRKCHEYIGQVPESQKEIYGTEPGEALHADFHTESYDLEFGDLSSMKKEIFMLFQGKRMQIEAGEPSGNETLVNVSITPSSGGLVFGHFNSSAPERNYEIYEYWEYKVLLYRLSDEIYKHMKARYIRDYYPLEPSLGFTPVTYTYTNITGGLGVFGGVSGYGSEWTRIE